MANWSYSDGGQGQYRSLNSGYCGVRALVLAEGMAGRRLRNTFASLPRKGRLETASCLAGSSRKIMTPRLATLVMRGSPLLSLLGGKPGPVT